jgi:hypothetical protein
VSTSQEIDPEMQIEGVSETSVFSSTLARLNAREDFSIFILRGSFISYETTKTLGCTPCTKTTEEAAKSDDDMASFPVPFATSSTQS